MGRRNFKPEEIIAHRREINVRLSKGETTGHAVRAVGITEQTYYRWRREYGGLKMDQAKRLKELERENQRLRKAVSDLTIDKMILEEAARGNV
jgi:transposase-like protein